MSGSVSWTVDPEVRMGIFRDLYAYVAGSYLVDREFDRWNQGDFSPSTQPVSMDAVTPGNQSRNLRIKRNSTVRIDSYTVTFRDFEFMGVDEYPEDATIAVRAHLDFTDSESGDVITIKPVFAIIRQNDENTVFSPTETLEGSSIQVNFINVNPNTEEIELQVSGISSIEEPEWVLLTIEKKPFVSVVWLGTILLMLGFSVSIMRRWKDQVRREEKEKQGEEQGDENKLYE
jgi:cytochrome c-type biogenesis protein CcmF